jgi:5-methylcytosine-specific restriction endonuclease McrA
MLDRDRDPVFQRDNWTCQFCGIDLLSDVRLFVTARKDHLLPKHKRGPDGPANRVASCCGCDALKAGRGDGTLPEARRIVAKRWQLAEAEYHRVRQTVRGES